MAASLRAALLAPALCWVLGLGSGLPLSAQASEPSIQPQLRIETGMHTTLIRDMTVDGARERLITGGDDKTVRIWQMPEGRLISVLRVPIDVNHEGQIFGIAVSPDGNTVAAAGWTGWDWDGKGSIYLFDANTGVLKQRIGGLPSTVNTLAFARDGKHLVAGLHMGFRGQVGFAAIELASGKIVAADNQYNDRVIDLDVAADGRVITVSYDGLIRLYDASFRLVGRRPAVGGARPITVRISPDGNFMAVGFNDQPAVTVHSARDLQPLARMPLDGIPAGQKSFLAVAWSSDGRHVFAGGEDAGSGANPVVRWVANGRSPGQVLPLGRNRISRLSQMPGNRMAFATEDPGVGVIEADGTVLNYRGPDIINFTDARESLRVSADGSVVGFPLSRDGKVRRQYRVFGPGDQVLAAEVDVPLSPPRVDARDWSVVNWKDSFEPLVNGVKVVVDPYEYVRSMAYAPAGDRVVFGTEWSVRAVDREGRPVWSVPVPAVAWAVNVSDDGRFVVAALSDGTLRWYAMRDGNEVLAFFPHGNGSDWISWTKDGYYASSIYGDNYIGWHLNRGKDTTPDFYRAVQFDRILYRPDVVARSFRAAMELPPDANLGNVAADFRIEQLREIAPPRLRVQVDTVQDAGGVPRAMVRLTGEKSALDMRDYTVFVNNIPVTPNAERFLAGNEARDFTRTVEVELTGRGNDIRVESFNGVAMGVAETFVGVARDPPRPRAGSGDLYLLAVGVNVFDNLPEGMHLAFAARDADEVAVALGGRGGGFYRQVHRRVLSDNTATKPTRAAIIEALEFVRHARANDTVVVFLASHGVSDPAGNYFFVPRDVTRADVASAQRGGRADSLISWATFNEALRGAAGKRILIVDTCHAGTIETKIESHALLKRSAASLFPMIMAAKGDEQSQEYEPGNHGLFTYAFLQSIRAESDRNRDGLISIGEMFEAAQPVVDRLREKTVGPQSPQLVAPAPLGAIPLIDLSALR